MVNQVVPPYIFICFLFFIPKISSNYTVSPTQTNSTSIQCNEEYEVLCSDGVQCIQKTNMCDGKRDCDDWSDESKVYCIGENEEDVVLIKSMDDCEDTWFSCRDALACLHPLLVCDGIRQCKDGSDEGVHCYYLNVIRYNATT